jgi:hypothetical protein
MHSRLIAALVVLVWAAAHAAEPGGFGQWKNGPPADPGYFPIAIWLQSPDQAAKYKAAGINLYVALWDGPTERQLAELKAAGMPVICDQNAVGMAHVNDRTIVGWMQPDEPDNAQEVRDPLTGKRGYGPPIRPEKIVNDYQKMRKADSTRPIYLGLGQGVANDQWNGRGQAGKPQDYPVYARGGDIISYDIYPIASLPKPRPEDFLWLIARGVDRIHNWTGGRKIQWNVVECTHIGNPERQATPHQVRAEVWMSLIHGSTGIVWFVHQFKPKFNEHALLDDPPMLAAVTAINHQIHDLAPILNSGDIAAVQVRSSSEKAPIDAMARRYKGATYVFAVGMRNSAAHATFTVHGLKTGATIEVIGEDRRISSRDGTFEDDFAPYDVRLYRITD